MDGFGVAWWSDTYEEFESGSAGKAGLRPVVYKNVRPPLNDLILQNLARGVSSNAVVAHIRAGTGVFVFVILSFVFCIDGEDTS
jgi:glutamine amidotransferase